MKRGRKVEKAFTLVELMVVVTILGILASIASIKVVQYLSRARIVKAKTDMKRIMSALDLFYMDSHEYPESLEELAEQTDEHPDGIISGIPRDPWGGEYEYVSGTDEHGGYELICYGRDGTEGGEGEDADIESWNMDQPEEGEEGYSEDSGG